MRLTILLAVSIAIAATALGQDPSAPATRPISPGNAEGTSQISNPCPAFDWSASDETDEIEFALYRIPRAADEGAGEPLKLYTLSFPGTARGWSPSLDQCLQPGERYAWALRGSTRENLGDWSTVYFFEVIEPGMSEVIEAMAVLERFLDSRDSGDVANSIHDKPLNEPNQGLGRVQNLASPRAESSMGSLVVPDRSGLRAVVKEESGVAVGALGISEDSDSGSSGVVGQATSTTGDVFGLLGQTASAAGSAAVFENLAGGDLIRGLASGAEVFSVDGSGQVGADRVSLTDALCFSGDCRDHWTWSRNVGGDLTYTEGKVGIGVAPTQALTVLGDISASGTICGSGGCVGSGGSVDWADITNKPTTFPPSASRSGDFRIFGRLTVDDDTSLGADLRVGVNGQVNPSVFIGSSGLVTIEAFYQDTARLLIKGFNDNVARTGVQIEADPEGRLTLFDSEPTQVPNTINQTVFLDGKSGSRGGKILLRDGLRGDPVIELTAYDPLTPVDVASIRLKGALLVQTDGGAGGYIEVDQVLLSSYLQLALTSGTPPSSDCNSASERGRAKFDTSTGTLWLCANSGWVGK